MSIKIAATSNITLEVSLPAVNFSEHVTPVKNERLNTWFHPLGLFSETVTGLCCYDYNEST